MNEDIGRILGRLEEFKEYTQHRFDRLEEHLVKKFDQVDYKIQDLEKQGNRIKGMGILLSVVLPVIFSIIIMILKIR